MAISSPGTWDRFNRTNVSLDAVTGAPAVDTTRAGAFGGAAADRPEARPESLFIAGERSPTGGAASSARGIFATLGVAPDSATAPSSLRAASVMRSGGVTHVVLQQQVAGTDVTGASVKIHLGVSGGFVVTGRPVGDLVERRPQDAPKATEDDAGREAARMFDIDPEAIREVKREVFPDADGSGRWTYRVSLLAPEAQADVRAYLDGSTLDLLLSFNVASALQGKATVFPVSPGRTPRLRSVRLGGLGPVPGDRLTGRSLTVSPALPPTVSRADRDFRLAATQAGFDEANAYHHLRRMIRYFAGILPRSRMPSPPFSPIRAVVRDVSSPNNAYYWPSTGELRFGDFGARPTARSADIVYHECAHAVSDSAARLARAPSDSQPRGLSEGYSDYFSNSILDDPRLGDWVAPAYARDSSNTALRFPPGFVGREHDTGAVWAAMLWSIRSQIGQPACDRLVLESLYYLGPQSTFADGRDALVAADRQMNRSATGVGAHESVIAAAWAARI